MRTSAALIRAVFRKCAHNRELLVAGERQKSAVVFQQNNARGGGVIAKPVVGVVVEIAARFQIDVIYKFQNAANGVVYVRFGYNAVAQSVFQVLFEYVVGIGHFEIESRRERFCAVSYRTPIGQSYALKSKLVAQDVREQSFILRTVFAVQFIVGAHYGGRLGFERDLERFYINLAQSAWVDDRIRIHSVRFLIVGSEMFYTRAHARRLYARDECRTQRAR